MRFVTLLVFLTLSISAVAQNYYMFVGTYTQGKSEGIYVFRFNAVTGTATKVSSIRSSNPSYLELSPNGKFLYAVNENGSDQPGGVSAFAFDPVKGRLRLLNKQQSGGADPCYISVNNLGNWAVVANYNGGNLAALHLRGDGSLDSLSQLIQHRGSGANPERQEKAHVHSVVFSPDQHYLVAADLGLDKEMIYQFDPGNWQPLADAKDSFVSCIPGSGPRHFVFQLHKPYAYLIEELSGTVDAYHYEDGQLINFQHISTHPDNFTGIKGSADIHISPDGQFLYASNRGDANNIAIFSIDPSRGKLKVKGFTPTLGKTPRNFMIDPTGHFLLVANQETGNIVIFRINRKTGMLAETGKQIAVPNPVCLKMLKIQQ